MRISIVHEITYSFEQPARTVMMGLKVMPRDHEGQHVISWRIEPTVDGRLRSSDDPFGNLTHMFQADGPFEQVGLRISGQVETSDTTGAVRATNDPAPAMVFLRQTPATQPDESVHNFAIAATRSSPDPLSRMHALMRAVHEGIELENDRFEPQAGAAAVLKAEAGAPSDLAHLLCGTARDLGIPARVAWGYLCDPEADGRDGRHAWVEAHLPGLGWIGFDPTLCVCPTVRHVRVAVGLDSADVTPLRMTRQSGRGETLGHHLVIRSLG